MEEENSISIHLTAENEEPEERRDPLAPTYPVWSTRWKCCQTYFCLSISYLSVMKFCKSLTLYGFTILIPYLIFTVFLGAPAVLTEILFGRYGEGNVLRTWSMCPPARGLFVSLFFVTCALVIERNLLNICILKYFFSCFGGTLPWSDCNEEWSRANCYETGKMSEAYLRCLEEHSKEYCSSLEWETAAAQYWKYSVRNAKGIDILWTITYLLISGLILLAIVFKGIYSLEKTLSKLVYPIFTLYAIVGVVSLSVPNAIKGFIKLFYFGWKNIGNIDLWIMGFFDVFLSNCVGTLALSFISGHGKFTDNILLDVFTVTFIGIISCLISTVPSLCAIKSVVNIEHEFETNDVSEVLIIISQALSLFPFPKVLWTALYFLNAFFMSLISQAITILAIAEALQNIFRKKSMNFWVVMVSLVSFVATAIIGVLNVPKYIDAGVSLAVNSILCTLTWQMFYGIDNYKNDFHFMMGYPVPFLIRCTWLTLLILPIVLIILTFYSYKKWQHLNVSISTAIVCVIYFFNILFYMLKTQKEKGKILTVFTATPDWGPENPLLKKSRKLFGVSSVTREFTYRQELNKKPLMKPPEFSQQNIVSLVTIY